MGKEEEKLWRKVENYCIDVQALPVAKEQEITKIGKDIKDITSSKF